LILGSVSTSHVTAETMSAMLIAWFHAKLTNSTLNTGSNCAVPKPTSASGLPFRVQSVSAPVGQAWTLLNFGVTISSSHALVPKNPPIVAYCPQRVVPAAAARQVEIVVTSIRPVCHTPPGEPGVAVDCHPQPPDVLQFSSRMPLPLRS